MASSKTNELGDDLVRWKDVGLSIEPEWVVEPDTSSIQTVLEQLLHESPVSVSFLAKGAFNKLYDVEVETSWHLVKIIPSNQSDSSVKTSDEPSARPPSSQVLRVSLPVDAYYKTMSEVDTMQWIKQNTALPIPLVLAFNPTRNDRIGFEWILMSKISGNRLVDAWKNFSLARKKKLVRQFAAFHSSLFQHQLEGIGNIYTKNPPTRTGLPHVVQSTKHTPNRTEQHATKQDFGDVLEAHQASTHEPSNHRPDVGRIVSIPFFWNKRSKQDDVSRGPFRSSKGWLLARLTLHENECHAALGQLIGKNELDSDDEDDVEDAERTLKLVHRLKRAVHAHFSDDRNGKEPSMICHDDMSMQNILVDKDGKLTGVVDWECVSALPLWKTCDYPKFLKGSDRAVEPILSKYQPDENGQPSELYWSHVMEHQKTVLRRVFLSEMRCQSSGWVEVFDRSQRERDLDSAIMRCDSEFDAGGINTWLDDLMAGCTNMPSLDDRINEPFTSIQVQLLG